MGLHGVAYRGGHAQPAERRQPANSAASQLRRGGPRRDGAEAGFTLVEICVSMLIIAMVSSGMFSVLLTARTNQVNSDYRQQAIVFTQLLDGALQNFSGDTVNGLDAMCKNLCGYTCGNMNCEPWITNDTCGTLGHAFSTGCQHTADSLLPTWFTNAPFNGHMCYQVHQITINGWQVNQVNTQVVWESTTTCSAP